MEEKLLTITELANKLGVSVFAIYGWMKKDSPCPFIEGQFGPEFIEVDVRAWHLKHCRQVRKFALKEPEE